MGTKVLLAVVCWLSLSDTFGVSAKTVNSSIVQDNESAASAPRLYRNVPAGVYASAAPYGAYTIQFPSFISAPKAAASHNVPVKHENIVFQNANGYLKDSYGNRFVDAPQMISYKTTFPQQFVQLQDLPSHLAQPLVAAAPSYQFKQLGPQHFVGSHFRQPSLQGPTPTPINSFVGSSQPLVYAGTFRSLAPSQNLNSHIQGVPTAQQQSTSNKAVYVNQAHQQYNNIKSEPKFQRLQEAPHSAHLNNEGRLNHHNQQNAKLQAAPAKQTAIHTVVNGQKTIINLETQPPLPLLDLSLLEPLTFANPLVPQVQHFLPRINQATYHKLPQANIDAVNYQKEFVVKKTKSYDSGNIKGKKPIQKKKPKTPQPEILDEEEAPPNPTVTFKGTPNEGPEFSYEINSPTYKETYKEKAVRYNKETNSEPVHYTYGTKTQNEPVTYSYTHSSKEPMQLKQIHYESNGKGPTQLIYNFKPDEQRSEHNEKPHNAPPRAESEDSRESFEDPDEGSRSYNQNAEHKDHYEEAPRQPQNYKPEHREEEYQQIPKEEYHQRPKEEYHQRPKEEYHQRPKEEYHQQPKGEYHQQPKEEYHQRPKEEYHQRPKEEYQRPKEEFQQRPKEDIYHKEVHHSPPHHNPSHDNTQRQHSPQHSTPHQNSPHRSPPHHYPQPIQVTGLTAEPIQAITQEYEEDIHIIPTHSPNGHIKVDPGQHVQHGPHQQSHDEQDSPPSSGPQSHQYEQNQEHREHHHPTPHLRPEGPAPHIHEKSKRVIIQEETPDEMHSLREQMIAEMIDQEENNEEDFEKAYKDAAFGFPAYSRQSVDVEKDIFNPGLYGIPREHSEYDIENTPFQQYQEEGDEYPKASRLTYKDTRDKTKDDYYLDYSVNKPESLTDRHTKKVDYYKLYKQSKPERHFADKEHDDKKKESHSAKYTALPTFEYIPVPEQKPKQFAHYKAAPQRFEYDYSKGTPRDNSAYASRPHQSYRSKTHFVEPQFQYGFEPISIPRLLDSELAAMASNNRPESEKPGMRKKVYKENWYIKKTSTSGGEPAS